MLSFVGVYGQIRQLIGISLDVVHLHEVRVILKVGIVQELYILERRTANPGILWVQKESRERARDANVVGAGNLNVRE